MRDPAQTKQQLKQENEDLKAELAEAQETLRAIREGEVDAIVVAGREGEQVFSLVGADSVYRLIVETMKEAAFTVAFDGRILFCNAQFGEFVRRPLEQIVGHLIREFVAPENRDDVESLLITTQARAVKQRLVFQNIEGAPVPAHVSSNVINQPDGLSICIVAADLTELENSTAMLQELRRQQEALQESEARLRAIFLASLDAIIIADDDGCCTKANPAVANVFGLAPEALVGRRIEEFAAPEFDMASLWARFKADGCMQSELRFVDAHGVHRTVEGYAIANILPGRHLAVLRDITERKNSEEALRRSEQNYKILVESERAARSEAERVARIKDEFLANLSHELRGPMSPIRGWVQILQRSRFDEKLFRQGLEVIDRSERTQTQLISDLLDMSRIISGKLRLDVQTCDLPAVLEASIESISSAAQAKSIRIQKVIDTTGPILGDPVRLQQVFWNLLSNAVKFTPKQGKIQIVASRINSHVEVKISDTGQGISPDFLPYIFERFRQADSSASKKQGGLGLGLAIAKHLVESHGGTVRAESLGEGHGAAFIVALPIMAIRGRAGVSEPAEGSGLPIGAESIHLTGIKVLLVDDESDTRAVIRRLLEDRGAEVLAVASAAEALAAFQAHKLDVLIGDIGMPDMDGYEMIKRIRALPADAGGEIPAVALTAFSRTEDRTRAFLAGYQYHLAKPVEFAELTLTLAIITKRIPRS